MLPTFTSDPDPSFSSSTCTPPFKVRFGVFPGVAAASLAAFSLGVLGALSSLLVSAFGVLASALGVLASALGVLASVLEVFASALGVWTSALGVLVPALDVLASEMGVLASAFGSSALDLVLGGGFSI